MFMPSTPYKILMRLTLSHFKKKAMIGDVYSVD